jgi:glycerophosphoryl diester phosphodiesterase
VAVCIGEARDNLDRHLSFGVDFIQPTRDCLTNAYVRRLLESGLPANVFYANEPGDMKVLIERGLPGIMTDRPDVLLSILLR